MNNTGIYVLIICGLFSMVTFVVGSYTSTSMMQLADQNYNDGLISKETYDEPLWIKLDVYAIMELIEKHGHIQLILFLYTTMVIIVYGVVFLVIDGNIRSMHQELTDEIEIMRQDILALQQQIKIE